MKARNIPRSQGGFTLVELLIAMALIVLLMTILTEAFSEGARTFDDFKAIGDLDEKLDDDCLALADRITATNLRASDFIQDGLRTGIVNRDEATSLIEQYESIGAIAAELESRLQGVQRRIDDPRAKRLLQNSLQEITRLKFSAATMARLLRLL